MVEDGIHGAQLHHHRRLRCQTGGVDLPILGPEGSQDMELIWEARLQEQVARP